MGWLSDACGRTAGMGTELIELSFTVEGYIARRPAEVYEAVADPEQLSKYFTTGGAKGRLEAETIVSWDFHDFRARSRLTSWKQTGELASS